jgi:hypothetical protein
MQNLQERMKKFCLNILAHVHEYACESEECEWNLFSHNANNAN